MKRVLHISTECYPMAKAGGMADVVGSLPLYQEAHGWKPSVITPRYQLPWYEEHNLRDIFEGNFLLEGKKIGFAVYQLKEGVLPYSYFCVDIPGLFDRSNIYLDEDGFGYRDEAQRNASFQRAVLTWLSKGAISFDLLHCHDHQVGFIPFMVKKVDRYQHLRSTSVFYTIHNGAYNSRYTWDRRDLLPPFDATLSQCIDWDGQMDAVAAAMRFADHVNTVSPTYLEELKESLPSLRFMSEQQPEKFSGILNGIDTDVWNPRTDALLSYQLTNTWDRFKKLNKAALINDLYHLEGIPLISFIGRFAHQKGGDLLVPAIERILGRFGFVNFYILGSGDPYIEQLVQGLRDRFSERVGCYIGYNEALAHQVYGASDFLVMPSRFEPCGLNQMFAMRYGTITIARMTGGLKDTVVDYESEGCGIAFAYDSVEDLTHAMARALHLYKDKKKYKKTRLKATKQDFSWTQSSQEYIDIYNQLTPDL